MLPTKISDYFDIKDKEQQIESSVTISISNLNFKKKEDMVNDIMRSVSIAQ